MVEILLPLLARIEPRSLLPGQLRGWKSRPSSKRRVERFSTRSCDASAWGGTMSARSAFAISRPSISTLPGPSQSLRPGERGWMRSSCVRARCELPVETGSISTRCAARRGRALPTPAAAGENSSRSRFAWADLPRPRAALTSPQLLAGSVGSSFGAPPAQRSDSFRSRSNSNSRSTPKHFSQRSDLRSAPQSSRAASRPAVSSRMRSRPFLRATLRSRTTPW